MLNERKSKKKSPGASNASNEKALIIIITPIPSMNFSSRLKSVITVVSEQDKGEIRSQMSVTVQYPPTPSPNASAKLHTCECNYRIRFQCDV